MQEISFTGLVVVAAVAVAAPLVIGLVPRLRLPAVVLEIVAGIIIGPAVLGWVEMTRDPRLLPLRAGLPAVPGGPGDRLRRGCAAARCAWRRRASRCRSRSLWPRARSRRPARWRTRCSSRSSCPRLARSDRPAAQGRRGGRRRVRPARIAAASIADFATIILLTLFFSREAHRHRHQAAAARRVRRAGRRRVVGLLGSSTRRACRRRSCGCRTRPPRSACAARSCCWRVRRPGRGARPRGDPRGVHRRARSCRWWTATR